MYFRVVLPMTKRETQNCKPFYTAETNCTGNCECGCASRGAFCGHHVYVNRRRLYRRNKTDLINYLVIISLVLTTHTAMTTANIMGDECDWFGSGLSTTASDGPGRGVTPVYLRCSQGHLEWVYPRGALRVLVRLGASGRDFRGCVKLGSNFGGARIFLEGPRSLVPLFSVEDGAPTQLVRCFQSRGGQAALYVEAASSKTDFKKEVASLTYDLEALPRGGAAYDPTEECRPCTEEEMAHAFCTSDLVTRGIIRSIENKDELEVSQLTIKVTKLLRRSTEDSLSSTSTPDSESNSVVMGGSDEQVFVNVALHCGVRHGTGEFVFMARRKLGDLALSCAPRLEDWISIVRKINKEGTAHCVLRS